MLLAVVAAVPVADALVRRPTPLEQAGETRSRARTRAPAGGFRAAVRTDVRSILRSPPLRRGLVLLLATPVAVSLLLPLPWVGIAVLPALVASGAALMHGVNVVALDGRGALWRESLPHDPDVTFAGRLVALSVLCGGSAVLLVLLAGLRATPPTPGELTAAAVAVPVATAQVVSRCARWSVRHPYPADLRRGRDTPAPPVAMAPVLAPAVGRDHARRAAGRDRSRGGRGRCPVAARAGSCCSRPAWCACWVRCAPTGGPSTRAHVAATVTGS